MLQFRTEPTVVDGLYVASLFKTGVFLVNQIDNLVVIADDMQLASRNVDFVKGDAVDAKLLNLTSQGQVAPQEIAALASADAAQCRLRCRVFDVERLLAHHF